MTRDATKRGCRLLCVSSVPRRDGRPSVSDREMAPASPGNAGH